MNIETYAKNENGGINFQIKIDEQTILCVVSTEALQDINPQAKMDDVEQQYRDNKNQFEHIATEKIKNKQVEDGKIYIDSSDIL